MNLSIERFDEFFRALWGYDPFPWQARLAKQVFEDGWPDCIDLPTASGKTAAIDIAVFVLACQAERQTRDRTVGRRIFFTVNRRVIVDEAFERAKSLAQKLLDAKGGILKEVAIALHEISGDKEAPPLDIAQLRGGIYRDRAWARSITQPIVVCTTADQLGSRLLFRGYGVSPSAAPIHAALCGCDSLVLLDEAHVTRAFSQTMQLITRYHAQRTTAPRIRFVQMTATPTEGVTKRFALDDADRSHPILKARQEASKPVTLVKLDKKKTIAPEIVARAFDAMSGTRKAIGIIVNRVQTARLIERLLQEEIDKRAKKDQSFKTEVHLVIGRMRPIDRDDLQDKLGELVGPQRDREKQPLENPIFVVATQCLEVGADYDFDALITECASVDALRQRFGRLNRRGRPIDVKANIITNEESLKGDDPIYGDAIKYTWEWLSENDRTTVDFGIAAFKKLWDEIDSAKRLVMLAPAADAAVLLPAHLDALCQTTNPQPVPSPDVSYFIHGPKENMDDVNICWRADLGHDQTFWPEIVQLLPPTSIECMAVPLRELRRWMMADTSKEDRDADVPVQIEPEDEHPKDPADQLHRQILIWRGKKDSKVTDDPRQLHPGDTVVMPTEYRNWNDLGHIPRAKPADYLKRDDELPDDHSKRCLQLDRVVDVAERATRHAQLRVTLRIHSAFPDNDPLRGLSDSDLRNTLIEREITPPNWNETPVARIERHQYRDSRADDSDIAPDQAIVFKRLLDNPNKLILPPDDEDDGDDNLSERDQFVSLECHTKHVIDRLDSALTKLHLNELESTVRTSAPLHDIGKADVRFQAMLAGITPFEALLRPILLGKGDGKGLSTFENAAIRERATLPPGFRHEMLSMQLVEHQYDELVKDTSVDRDLLLHLDATHHGNARPFAPVVIDDTCDETYSVTVRGISISPEERRSWMPAHRLDSGVAERFWKLTQKHGWWGLAWLESILRLADQQASQAEQEKG